MKIILRTTSVLMGLIALLIANTAWADFAVVNTTLVETKRVGRVEFEYTYTAQVTNSGADAANVIAQATSSSPYTTIVDGQLEFGDVAGGATQDSIDTFTVKQDRRHPVDWSAVVWSFQSLSGVPEDVDLGIHTGESQGGGGLIRGPVRIINGNSLEMRTDLKFASPHAGGLVFTAVYNSRRDAQGAMGYGWSHTYEAALDPALSVSGQTLLKITDATGRGVYFFQETSNQYRGAFHERSHVSREGDEFIWYRLDGSRYGFGANGRLAWIEDQNANRINLGYDGQNRLVSADDASSGRTLKFHYFSNGRLEYIEGPVTPAVPTGRWVDYQYNDTGDKLESIKYADGSVIAYEYSDPVDSHNLTLKRDGVQHLMASWKYDSQDRCVEAFNRSGGTARMDYSQSGRVIVKDGYDVARTFIITTIGGRKRVTDLQGPGACSFCKGDAVHWEYDADMNLTQVVSAGGAVTRYNDFDQRGNPATVVIGSGSPYERTVSQTYHPRLNTPLTVSEASLLGDGLRETIWDYDNDGNLTPNENPTNRVSAIIQKGYTINIDEQVVPYEYRITYACNAKGQPETVNGPLPGDDDVYIYDYDPATGDLLTVTQPLIGSTSYGNYDAAGQPRRITDVNGVVREIEYNGRCSMLRIANQSDGSSTEIAYDSNGQRESTKDADNITHTFQYENQFGRLTRLLDGAGNYLDYTYEDQGRLTQSAIYDASGQQVQLKRWSYQHPSFPGRPYQEIYPDNTATTFEYYPNGNLQSRTDPKNNTTSYAYDIFNRLHEQTQAGDAVTRIDYDRRGNLVSVIDPEQRTTTYQYDDAGRLIITTSPDAGKEVRAYDAAGRLQYVKDARGVTTTNSYDAMNRLTAIAYPEFEGRPSYNVTYTYDEGQSGMGRLTGIFDLSGHTQFDYSEMDSQGRLTKIATINGTVFTTTRETSPGGRLESLTYPSGRTVTYARNILGQLAAMATSLNGTSTPLVSDLTYSPFGPATGMNLPNIGEVQNRLDQLQRPDIANPDAGSGHGLGVYQYDSNSNLEKMTAPNDTRRNQVFGYSALNRLTSATGSYGSLEFSYDAVGNRTTKTEDDHTDTYTYLPGTNLIDVINGATVTAFGYDARGNTTAKGAMGLAYDQNNRLVTVRNNGTVAGEYIYNGLGQRVIKNAGGITTYYHYDLQGNLIAETPPDADFTGGSEYIFNGLTAIAKADIATSEIYLYHVNHLGVPEFMTDSSGAVVWQATVKPFGDATVNQGSTLENPIRFPGHYYDKETGFYYNNNRYYDPNTGRYLTADPVGLAGSLNPYTYAQNNPVNAIDPLGLFVWGVFFGGNYGKVGVVDASVAFLAEDLHDFSVAGDVQITGGPQAVAGVSAGVIIAPFADLSDLRGVSDRITIRTVFGSIGIAIPDDIWKTSISIDFVPGLEAGVGFGKGGTLFPEDIISATNQMMDALISPIKAVSPLLDLLRYISTHDIRFTRTFDPRYSKDGRYSPIVPTIPAEYQPMQETTDYLMWPTAASAHNLAVSDDGYVYVADTYSIEKFDDQGNLLATWGSQGTEPGQFWLLMDLDVDSQGFVYAVDYGNKDYDHTRIQEFDSEGSLITDWNSLAIAITVRDNIVYTATGSVLLPSDKNGPMIETYDSNGNYLGGWGTIVALGNGTTGCEDYGPLDFNNMRGMFVDAERNRLFVTDVSLHDVRVMDVTGNFIDRWGHCTQPGPEGGQFETPTGVVVDDQGIVYIVDRDTNTIKVHDSDGNYLHSWGTYGSEAGQFDEPNDIAIDSHGYIYILDMGNDRILKVHSSVIKNGDN